MKKCSSITFHKQRGVTLIELVLAMIIMSIVTVSMSNFLSGSGKAYNVVESSIESFNKLGFTMERLGKELKTISHTGSQFDIQATSSLTRIVFVNTDATPNTVTIDYSGSTLTISYSVPGPATAHTLTNNVSDFSFTYYQSDGDTEVADPSANPELVDFIEYDLTITEDGKDFRSKSRVALRNL